MQEFTKPIQFTFMYGSISQELGMKRWHPNYDLKISISEQFEENKRNGYLEEWKHPFDTVVNEDLFALSVLQYEARQEKRLSFFEWIKSLFG